MEYGSVSVGGAPSAGETVTFPWSDEAVEAGARVLFQEACGLYAEYQYGFWDRAEPLVRERFLRQSREVLRAVDRWNTDFAA